jgi:ADP-ribosylation factor GTPase-activating protein 2/3
VLLHLRFHEPGTHIEFVVSATSLTSGGSSSQAVDDSPTIAREKFGNQKAISSDMYFERNAYDPSVVSEAQSRLQSFQGATSISSNAYFGRDEEDDLGGERRSGEGLLGDSSLAGLEVAAKDAISRVMSNPDVQNAAESIRSGALKASIVWSLRLNPSH